MEITLTARGENLAEILTAINGDSREAIENKRHDLGSPAKKEAFKKPDADPAPQPEAAKKKEQEGKVLTATDLRTAWQTKKAAGVTLAQVKNDVLAKYDALSLDAIKPEDMQSCLDAINALTKEEAPL